MQPASESPPLWFCLVVCISGGTIYGYHSGVIGPALAHRECHGDHLDTALFPLAELLGCGDDDCSAGVISLVSATFIVGAMTANMCGSALARAFGVHKLLLAAAIICTIGSAGTVTSKEIISFSCWRGLVGIGVGLLSFGVPFWVSDVVADGASRGRVMGYFPLAIVGAIFTVYFFGVVMSYSLCIGGKDLQWRLLYGGSLLPTLVFLAAVIYETRRVTAASSGGRPADYSPLAGSSDKRVALLEGAAADAASAGQRPASTGCAPAKEAQDEDEGDAIDAMLKEDNAEIISPLWWKQYSWVWFAFGIAACQQLTGINALISYTPGIFEDAGASNSLISATATNGINVVVTLLSGMVVDRVGRRPLLVGSLTLMTVSLFGVAVMFLCIDNIDSDAVDDVCRIVMILFLMAYFAGFALGPGPLFYLICAETFPAQIRDRAMATANFFLWTFNLFTVTSFPFLYKAIGQAPTFFLCGAVSLGCLIFAIHHVKETKHNSFVRSPLLAGV